MANALYPKWKEAVMQHIAGSSLAGSGTTGVYAALLDSADYTYSASHEFYSSIAAAIVGTPIELTSKTFVAGLFDAADSTLASVSGDQSEAIGIYIQNAGANTTWRLVAYLDTGITGSPVTPNGGNIGIGWNASGIFQL
jgi:hypothetical protein